jgi:hypothetical protein
MEFVCLCPYSVIPYASKEVVYDADHCLVNGNKLNIPYGLT